MKPLLLTILSAVTINVQAATVELGKYRAVDAATRSTVASFELKANGTVNFQVRSPEFEVTCSGKYAVRGNEFSTNLACDSFLLPEASVKIDISTVSAESVRSVKGAEVNVIIDALGDEPVKYHLKKIN